MLEYVFFNAEPCERFLRFLEEKGLHPTVDERDIERIVTLPEEALDDDLADQIDIFYDEMFDLDQRLYDDSSAESPDDYHASGVVVNINDGRAVYADVRPALLSKVMGAISAEELGELVDAIVKAVEDPDERTFCQRMRGEGGP
jgi:hypothetical protein